MRDWVHEVVDTYITDYEIKPLFVIVAGFLLWGVLTGTADYRDILLIIAGIILQFGVAPWCIGKIIGKIQKTKSAKKETTYDPRKHAVKVVQCGHAYIFNDRFGSETVQVSSDGEWVTSRHGNWLRISSVKFNGKQYYVPGYCDCSCSKDGYVFTRSNHVYNSENGINREMICAIMLHEAEHAGCKGNSHSNCAQGAVYQ